MTTSQAKTLGYNTAYKIAMEESPTIEDKDNAECDCTIADRCEHCIREMVNDFLHQDGYPDGIKTDKLKISFIDGMDEGTNKAIAEHMLHASGV